MKTQVTYLGTATVLIEIGDSTPFRILTDPALDPAGKRYSFGYGVGSKKLTGPAISAKDLPQIDLVLLSHDHHADNLDDEGRTFLPKAAQTFTTVAGSKRLSKDLGPKVVGMSKWQSQSIRTQEGWDLKVTAVPAKHGEFPLPEMIVGQTIGFVLEWPGQSKGPLYISGDTVYFSGIQEIADRFKIGTAFMHLGGVQFSISGPLHYTFDSKGAVKALKVLNPQQFIPVHFDGWTHFHESIQACEEAFRKEGYANKVLRLKPGQPTELKV